MESMKAAPRPWTLLPGGPSGFSGLFGGSFGRRARGAVLWESPKIKILKLSPVPAPSQGASQKRVETEVSTAVLKLTNCLEVDLQSKLPEAALVIRTTEVADAALGRRDRHRHPVPNVGNIIQPSLDVEIVMVQQIKSLCAKLNVDLFMDWKDLADGSIEGPGPGSAEAVTSDIRRRERAPVGDSLRKPFNDKSWISEGRSCRKAADLIAVRAPAIHPARYLRKAVLRNNSSRWRVPRDLIATVIVRAVEVIEWHTRTDCIDARHLPATQRLIH